MIDPGHGGTEIGAVGHYYVKKGKESVTRNVFEKTLSLKLAVRVKKLLEKKYSVYLTRSIDRTVSLQDRAKMADTVKADLFISIHMNSSTEHRSSGFETYYLDNHDNVAIHKVERVENQNIGGADKIVNQILIDLVIQKTVGKSKSLASLIHSEVQKRVAPKYKMKNRGIKPGLFYVLALSKRPGVLIEAGFMSNRKDLIKMRQSAFLDAYAEAISIGVVNYIKTLPVTKLPIF